MQTPTLIIAMVTTASLLGFQADAELITVTDIILDGFQPVPPTGSLGSGIASMVIDTSTRFITIEGMFWGLEGDVIFGHLHGPARIGQNSNIVITPLFIEGDFMRSGTFSVTHRVSPFQLNAILDSRSYINIHSTAFPDGEIRGQVVVPTPGGLGFVAMGALIAIRRKR